MPRLLLALRGDPLWGSGHLHRGSWLLAALRENLGPEVQLQVACLESAVARSFWTSRGIDVLWMQSASDLLALLQPDDCCVIDWLDSLEMLVAGLSQAGVRLILLDDHGPAQMHADLVINALLAPLANAAERLPAPPGRAEGALILSGAGWVQFPPAAVKIRNVARATARALQTELAAPVRPAPTATVYSVLISFGGLANAPATALALQALELAGYRGSAIVMPCESLPPSPYGFRTECLPGSADFHALLAAADVAICAGGLTLYESALLGIPAICLPLKVHQLETGRKLEAAGSCICSHPLDDLSSQELSGPIRLLLEDAALRGRMSARGQALFDGGGLLRTVSVITELQSGQTVSATVDNAWEC